MEGQSDCVDAEPPSANGRVTISSDDDDSLSLSNDGARGSIQNNDSSHHTALSSIEGTTTNVASSSQEQQPRPPETILVQDSNDSAPDQANTGGSTSLTAAELELRVERRGSELSASQLVLEVEKQRVKHLKLEPGVARPTSFRGIRHLGKGTMARLTSDPGLVTNRASNIGRFESTGFVKDLDEIAEIMIMQNRQDKRLPGDLGNNARNQLLGAALGGHANSDDGVRAEDGQVNLNESIRTAESERTAGTSHLEQQSDTSRKSHEDPSEHMDRSTRSSQHASSAFTDPNTVSALRTPAVRRDESQATFDANGEAEDTFPEDSGPLAGSSRLLMAPGAIAVPGINPAREAAYISTEFSLPPSRRQHSPTIPNQISSTESGTVIAPIRRATVTATAISIQDLQEEIQEQLVAQSIVVTAQPIEGAFGETSTGAWTGEGSPGTGFIGRSSHSQRSTEAKGDALPSPGRRRVCLVNLVLSVLLGAVAVASIVAGVVFGTSPVNEAPSPAPTQSSPDLRRTRPLTESDLQLLRLLKSMELTEGLYTGESSPLGSPQSPQYDAFLSLALSWKSFSQVELVERYALACFYYSTGGDDWDERSGWLSPSLSPCEWFHSRMSSICDKFGRVSALVLENNHLVGPLAPEISYLSSLTLLSLGQNSLKGGLPQSLMGMAQLTDLSLGGSDMSGSIPFGISSLSRLKTLHVGSNNFSGALPPSIGALTQLQYLNVERTRLGGSIPESLGRLRQLRDFIATSVSFEGTLPSELGLCTALETLDLAGNGGGIYGTIAPELYNLSQLRFLSLTRVGLQGTISPLIGKFSRMIRMDLGRNRLHGTIPEAIGLLSRLEEFRFNKQNISGSLPGTIGNCRRLEVLLGMNNQLTGPIPSSVGGLISLRELRLNDNNLNGTIPASFADLIQLTTLELQHNRLSGPAPFDTFAELKSLRILELQGNRLSGELPTNDTYWSRFQSLVSFGIGDSMSGTIPPALTEVPLLESLYLQGNLLQGTLPSELGMLTDLQILAVANNELTGLLPDELSELSLLTRFHAQSNQFLGAIPASFAVGWSAIDSVYLDGNALRGMVPFCSTTGGDHVAELYADCSEVVCDCCTHCCDSKGECRYMGDSSETPAERRPSDYFPDTIPGLKDLPDERLGQ